MIRRLVGGQFVSHPTKLLLRLDFELESVVIVTVGTYLTNETFKGSEL